MGLSGFKLIMIVYFLFLSFCLIAVHLTGKSFKKINGVAIANEENIHSMIFNYQNVVLFFTNQKQSQQSEEYNTFQKLAMNFEKNSKGENSIIFARVNEADIGQTLSQYKATKFPSVFITRNQQYYQYKNEKFDSVSLDNWIQRKTLKPCQELASIDDLLKAIESAENQNLVLHTPKSQVKLEKLIEISRESENFQCFYTNNQSIQKSGLAFYSQFQKEGIEIKLKQTELTTQSLFQFIQQNNLPALIPFNKAGIELIFHTEDVQAIFLISKKQNNPQIEILNKIAQKRKGLKPYISVCSQEGDQDGVFQKLIEFLGVKESQIPENELYIVALKNDKKFNFEESFSESSVQNFIQNFIENKLQAKLKTQPVPLENNQPVKIIVGQTFKEIVINNSQDVLVEFYAPWCGHCKKFTNIYDELALKLNKNKNLVIAKIDSTENDIEEIKVEGFPTFYLFVNGKKNNPILFEGERTLEGVESFLKSHTSYSWIE